MACEVIGWDIGGAHLKAAALDGDGLVSVIQKPCPLWLGLAHFHAAASAILDEMAPTPACRHAVTMTGELADLFPNREAGVFGLLRALGEQVPPARIQVFAGAQGFLELADVRAEDVPAIASANWLATGFLAAARLGQGLLVDLGSTTADLLILSGGAVRARGHTDYERLRHEELVYCGVVRTSLMSLAQAAPFDGEWIGLMAEHFATAADVYRLTGELPEHADQVPAADGGEKTAEASARRLARLLGRDVESADGTAWRRLAGYFRERQLARLADACHRQISLGRLDCHAPVIGAGVGRFLVQELARRLGHPYLDFADLLPTHPLLSEFHSADCAPAVAVACLARGRHG
jgi:probable H4MPT-linked C1 transfer pathway protein